MPKDMFYNYDNEYLRNKKECPQIIERDLSYNLNSPSSAFIIKDVRGDEMGIRAYAGQDLTLYFHIMGIIVGDTGDLLNPIEYFQQGNFLVKLLDNSNRVAYEISLPGTALDDCGVLCITLSGKELVANNIKKDIYRISVEAVVNEESCPIFYENDAFLSFI